MWKATTLFLIQKAAANPACWSEYVNEDTCCHPLDNGGNSGCWDDVFDFDFCCGHLVQEESQLDVPAVEVTDISPEVVYEQSEPDHEHHENLPPDPNAVDVFEYTPYGVVIDDAKCRREYEMLLDADHQLLSGMPGTRTYRTAGMPNQCLAQGMQYRWVAASIPTPAGWPVQTTFGMCLPGSCSSDMVDSIIVSYISIQTREDVPSAQINAVPYTPIGTAVWDAFTTPVVFIAMLVAVFPVVLGTIAHFFGKQNNVSLQHNLAELCTTSFAQSPRSPTADFIRAILLFMILAWHGSPFYPWAFGESNHYWFGVLRGPLQLGNSGFFFLSGYLLVNKSLSFKMVSRKLFRQLPLLAAACFFMEFGILRMMDMGNRFLSDNPIVSAFDCQRKSMLGLPFSLFPVIPGVGRYCHPNWAWGFELKTFFFLASILFTRKMHRKLGNVILVSVLGFAVAYCTRFQKIMWPPMSYGYNLQAYMWAALLHKNAFNFRTSYPWCFLAVTLVFEFLFLHHEWSFQGEESAKWQFGDFASLNGLYHTCIQYLWNLYRIPLFIAMNSWLDASETPEIISAKEFSDTPGSDGKRRRRSEKLPVWPPPPKPSPERDNTEMSGVASSSDASYIKPDLVGARAEQSFASPIKRDMSRFSTDESGIIFEGSLWLRVRNEVCSRLAMISYSTLLSHPFLFAILNAQLYPSTLEFQWVFVLSLVPMYCFLGLVLGLACYLLIERPWYKLLLRTEDSVGKALWQMVSPALLPAVNKFLPPDLELKEKEQ